MGYYRFDPVQGFERFAKQFEGLRNDFAKGVNFEFGKVQPRVEITEDDAKFYVTLEIPGVDKQDVKIRITDDNILTITGEKKKQVDGDMKVLRNERHFGEFSRALSLPDEADTSKISAQFTNGLLEIAINKKEKTEPKTYDVTIN